MSNPVSLARRMNLSAVVQAITNYGPTSRTSIARITGLSKQTVGEIIASLEADGWVRATGRTQGAVGRRALVYEMVPDAALIASVDLGGTKVRVALCDLVGDVMAETVEPTAPEGGTAVIDQIARLVRDTALADNRRPETIRVAVVGVPGVPDPASGAIRFAPNIPGLDTIDCAGALRARLGIEVLVDNDVNLAALGEHWMADEDGDMVFVSIGTGIGAGVIIGGQLLRGANGAAGELAYLPFGADPFEPESHMQGALERVAATEAIRSRYRTLTDTEKTVPDIFAAMCNGDDAARQALMLAARHIALAIGAVATLIDPARIVIGGSIGEREEMLDMIRTEIEKSFPRKLPISASVLGNRAALAGGTAIALSHLHLSLFAADIPDMSFFVSPPDIGTYREQGDGKDASRSHKTESPK